MEKDVALAIMLTSLLILFSTLGATDIRTSEMQTREGVSSTTSQRTLSTVTKSTSLLSWSPGAVEAGWHGWWFRYNTEWFQFNFSGICATGDVTLDLYLSVANHANGEFGLDGLVDVVINPGLTPSITFTDVLLDNVDPNNHVYAHNDPSGSARAHGQITVPNMYVLCGALKVRVLRHVDSNMAPTAPICTEQPINMTTGISAVSGSLFIIQQAL